MEEWKKEKPHFPTENEMFRLNGRHIPFFVQLQQRPIKEEPCSEIVKALVFMMSCSKTIVLLVSMSIDRHDKEKEMAPILFSALYADIIHPSQVYKGFTKLVESTDDLIMDIPNTVDILALFIARVVVDGILPPTLLKKQIANLPNDSKGAEVLMKAEKSYLTAPSNVEIIERRWGGSKNTTIDNVKARINKLTKFLDN
ncbi:unnamed protein product [Vicia faba]|uniref:MI domain-containing protein n=1 Tax=Vicia faba TaxID=3906 RepID=A0AAV0Z965_VICFA|nr:unnamed protein product [Vicia faba]